MMMLLGPIVTVLAQSDMPAVEDVLPVTTELRWFDHFIVAGGWITWFALIPLSVTMAALALENLYSVRGGNLLPKPIIDDLEELLREKRYGEALKLAAQDRSMIAFVLHAGLLEAKSGYEAMERAMEQAIEERAAKLTRKIEYLNLIGNVAPMLGLLGTVNGIIGMFISIAGTSGIPVMARISSDLGSALVCTFWGLLVAIPALTVFGMLRNRIDSLMEECAVTADRLMTVFKSPAVEPARHPPVAEPNAVPAVAV